MSEGISRGKVTAAIVKGGRVLLDVALLHGQQRSRVELLLPAGFTMVPAIGADVLVLQVAGNADHRVAVVADAPAQRVTGLAAGEIGLRDAHGQQVVLSSAGVAIAGATAISITSSGPVVLTAPSVKLGSSSASKAVKLADGSNATKVFAE